MQYIIEKIKTKLYEGLKNKVAYIYVGDPQEIPNEVLEKGCITIAPQDQDVELKETQRDEDNDDIVIVVLKDMRSEIGKKPQTMGSLQWILDVVDGRDGSGALKQNTIRYIMRKSLNEIGAKHSMKISYGSQQRDEGAVRAAVVTISVIELINRPS